MFKERLEEAMTVQERNLHTIHAYTPLMNFILSELTLILFQIPHFILVMRCWFKLCVASWNPVHRDTPILCPIASLSVLLEPSNKTGIFLK